WEMEQSVGWVGSDIQRQEFGRPVKLLQSGLLTEKRGSRYSCNVSSVFKVGLRTGGYLLHYSGKERQVVPDFATTLWGRPILDNLHRAPPWLDALCEGGSRLQILS